MRKLAPHPLKAYASVVLVFFVPFALFSPSLAFDFVYDARYQILSSDFLHTPSNWWSVLSLRVIAMDVLDFNRPVQLGSLMLDSLIWGRNPLGYHLTNVFLHALNSVLVFLVAKRILISRTNPNFFCKEQFHPCTPIWPALAGALLFAVHPIQVEAVCEPSYREDLLVVFFTLAAILLASGSEVASGKIPRWMSGAACIFLCFLACAAKETGFVVAGILLLWRTCIDTQGQCSRKWWLSTLLGCFLATAIFAALRFTLEPPVSNVFESKPEFLNGSFFAALSAQPQILAMYFVNFFSPWRLCADYGPFSLLPLSSLEASAALSVFLVVSALAAWHSPRVAFCLGFIVLALLPVSNLLPMFRPAADRYLYQPMAGVGMLAAVLMSAIPIRGWIPGLLRICFAAIIFCFGLMSWHRQTVWRDSQSLWNDTAKKNPASRNAWLGLGFDLQRRGFAADSVSFFQKTLKISGPKDAEAWMGLAVGLDAIGDPVGAKEATIRALELLPDLRQSDSRVRHAIMEREHARDTARLLQKYSLATP